MTPKEQAEYLWHKFDETIALNSWADEKTSIDELVLLPKKCALVAVDEILHITSTRESWFDIKGRYQEKFVLNKYWVEVKQEIEKL